MKTNILATIIIPVYNGEKFIKETIESCLNQTIFTQLEIIVIDDASTDSSISIINDFNFIKLIRNKINRGIARNINKGIEMANGEYVMLLGHDDLLEPSHIEIMINEFDKNTSFAFCDSFIIDSQNNKIGESNILPQLKKLLKKTTYNFVYTNYINSCGLLFKRESALKVGKWDINEEFPNFGEWKFWIKLSCMGEIKYTEKIKSYYRRHDTNITNSFKGKITPLKLFNYYMDCRKLAFRKGEFSLLQKIQLSVFMLNLKNKYRLKTILYGIFK